jgi:hypothetical protein
LPEPRRLPAGAKIQAFAVFDNSTGNLANPDPSKTVRWGEQSWDEMLLGYFDVAVPKDTDSVTKRVISAVGGTRDPAVIAKRIVEALDKNKDGKLSRDEFQPAQFAVFDKVDTDGDGIVSEEEIVKALPELRKLIRP